MTYLELDTVPDPVRPQVLLSCGTVLLALLALSSPPLSLWPLALLVLVLWPREVLSAPERALRAGFLPEEHHPALTAWVRELSSELGLAPPPRLAVLPASARGPFVVGSWRRTYLCMGDAFAQRAERAQTGAEGLEVEAILLHELAHLRHGDPVKVELARSLLRVAARATAWMVLFVFGGWAYMGLCWDFALEHRPSELGAALDARFALPFPFAAALLADDSAWEGARALASSAMRDRIAMSTLGNLLPIGFLAALPLAWAVRRMLRLRELMADAAAFKVYRRRAERTIDPKSLIDRARAAMASSMGPGGSFHPGADVRLGCLRKPEQVLGSLPAAALHLGVFLLLLEVVVESTAAAQVVGVLPVQLPVFAGALLLGNDIVSRAAVEALSFRRLVVAVCLLLLPTALGLALNLLVAWAVVVADPDGGRALLEGAMGMLHLGDTSLGSDLPGLLGDVALTRAAWLGVDAVVLVPCALVARALARRGPKGEPAPPPKVEARPHRRWDVGLERATGARRKPDRLPVVAGVVGVAGTLFILFDLAIPTFGLPALFLALLALLLSWAAFCALLWVAGDRADRPWAFGLCVALALLARATELGRGPSVGARLFGELLLVFCGFVVFHGIFLAFRRDRGARLLAVASLTAIWGAWFAWARDPTFLARAIYDRAPVEGALEGVGLAALLCGIGLASFVAWSVRLVARELLGRDPS